MSQVRPMNIRAYHILSTIRGQQQHSLSSAVFLDRKQIKRKEKKKDEEDSVVSPARRTQRRRHRAGMHSTKSWRKQTGIQNMWPVSHRQESWAVTLLLKPLMNSFNEQNGEKKIKVLGFTVYVIEKHITLLIWWKEHKPHLILFLWQGPW